MRGVVVTVVVVAVLAIAVQQSVDWHARSVPLEWKDKRVVVTGASSGIGKALAELLASKGARLLLTARRGEALERVKEQALKKGSPEVVLVVGDLGTHAGVQYVIEKTKEAWKSVDVLILNHGTGSVKSFATIDENDLDHAERIMFTNLHSNQRLVHGLRKLVPKGGSIAAVGSLAGIVGPPNRAFYAPSKSALRSFFQVLAHDLRDEGIYFTYLAPGYVLTEIHDVAHGGAKRVNLDRFMTAEKCAALSLDAIAKGRREFRYEWMPVMLTPLEGFGLYTGIMDGFVRRKANEGVVVAQQASSQE